ncbi:MAG: hypothetical protein A2Y77_18425 [Planctomycetes bacterium RBG_13_62_9]|nr:MAG: hypothetical protein A2Y77_18425 [Planctomycetes bacterium RBG_13_62_9]
MKLSNTVVSVIVIAAVLVCAYAVGMLIHQTRSGEPQSRAVADANGAASVKPTEGPSHAPGSGQVKDTPELRAQLKEQRKETLEKLDSATPEQTQQFRDKVRKQFGGRRGGKGSRGPAIQQREVRKVEPQSQPQSGPEPQQGESATPESESTNKEQNTEGPGA